MRNHYYSLKVIRQMVVCLGFLMSLPLVVMGQDQVPITMNLENRTIEEVLETINKRYDYTFVMLTPGIDTQKRVSVNANDQPIDRILASVFKGQDVSFEVDGKTVRISKTQPKPQPTPQAPQQTVSGTVVDPQGNPLPAVVVRLKGTYSGSVTDNNGNYTIRYNSDDDILEFSFLGYTTTEAAIGGRSVVDVVMNEDILKMDEVVVVGYGSQKKSNLSGSVSSVSFDSDKVTSRPLTNVSSALSGLVPGLNVRQQSGTPGADGASLTLRGATLSGGSPYVLIDGAPGDLNQISPNDVENITILKDAASAAIYGNKAANGVILITTKSGAGHTGKVTFEYNGNVGWSSPTNLFDIIDDTADHMTVINNILANSGQGKRYTQDYIDNWREKSKTDPLKYPNTNWWDAIFKRNIIHTHQFSARGGNDKISFYTSANYQNNDGLIVNSAYESFNFRSNVEYRVNDWLKIGNIMTAMYGENEPGRLGETFQWFMATTPGMVPKAPDGRYGSAHTIGESGANNLLYLVESWKGSKEKRRFTTKFFTEITPIKGLVINANFYKNYYSYYESYVWDDQPLWNFQTETMAYTGMDPEKGLRRQNTESKEDDYTFDVYVTYGHNWGKHDFKIMGGYEQGLFVNKGFNNLREGIYSVDVPNATADEDLLHGASRSEDAYMSAFTRVNYNYAGKYMLEVNWRFDGSSRFADGYKWGNFPSASVAWRISEEGFWDGARRIVDNFKLRASYGKLGNNNVDRYATHEVYSSGNYPFGGKISGGLVPGGFVSKRLTWEETDMLDIGLDISFLRRFSLSVDFYDKNTRKILTQSVIPFNNGTSSGPLVNGPQVRNRGVEFELAYAGRVAKDLNLFAKVNGGFNQNKVIRYQGADKMIQGGGTPFGYIVEGYPIGQFYIMQVDHIVQDKAEIDRMIADGYRFGLSGAPGEGDFLFKNTLPDKRINEDDRVLIGNPQPVFTYGASLGLECKGIDFNMLLTGVAGWDRYIQNQFDQLNAHLVGYLYPKSFLDMYTDENPSTTHPKVYTNSTKNEVSTGSDWHLHKADYLRIKSLQLGYTLPSRWTRKAKMEKVRLYVNLENFFTFTSYPGLDPEGGGDINYPLLKTVSCGLNVKF